MKWSAWGVSILFVSVILSEGSTAAAATPDAGAVRIEGMLEGPGWVVLHALVEDGTWLDYWQQVEDDEGLLTLGAHMHTKYWQAQGVAYTIGEREGAWVDVREPTPLIESGDHVRRTSLGGPMADAARFKTEGAEGPTEYHLLLYAAGGAGRYNWTFSFEGTLLSLRDGKETFLASFEDCPYAAAGVVGPGSGVPGTAFAAGGACTVDAMAGFHGAFLAGGVAMGMGWQGPDGTTGTGSSHFIDRSTAGRYTFDYDVWLGVDLPVVANSDLFLSGADVGDFPEW